MQKFLRLEFVPASSDLGLLLLRVSVGASMLWLHGWGKLLNFVNGRTAFPDIAGMGQTPSLLLAIFAEVVCAALIVAGAYTRWAAVTMGVAFFLVNHARLTGPTNGELAFLYLAGALVLLIAGAGKYSIDRK